MINIVDITNFIDNFIIKYNNGIKNIYYTYNKTGDKLSFQAFVEELKNELYTGSITFVNNHDSLDGIDSYLFYIVNIYAKRTSTFKSKYKTEYLCPGCFYLHKENLIYLDKKIFKCEECCESSKLNKDPKYIVFFKTFAYHNRKGYKCQECNRFIPHPLYGNNNIVSCPYLDCCFVGDIRQLKSMRHPSINSNPEQLIANVDIISNIQDKSININIENKETLECNIKLIQDIINTQITNIPYNGTNFTLLHKTLAYNAFSNLLKKFPEELVNYIIYSSRSGGFQYKIFQEYIRLLEENIPFSFIKGKKVYYVDSLLDNNLNIFGGISYFDAKINDNLIIKNNTQEFYIGGRKGSYAQPYYIGKLLNIIDKNSNNSLMDYVKEYSFSKIKMKNVEPNTNVMVAHLRIPPHYQMGGMVYINRVRQKIVNRAHNILEKEFNE